MRVSFIKTTVKVPKSSKRSYFLDCLRCWPIQYCQGTILFTTNLRLLRHLRPSHGHFTQYPSLRAPSSQTSSQLRLTPSPTFLRSSASPTRRPLHILVSLHSYSFSFSLVVISPYPSPISVFSSTSVIRTYIPYFLIPHITPSYYLISVHLLFYYFIISVNSIFST